MFGLRDFRSFPPDRKYLFSHLTRTLSLLLALFLVFYLFYHIGDGFQTKLETSFARTSEAQKTLTAKAYVFRDESTVAYEGGTVRYHYGDYEKVEANGRLATVYGSDGSNALDARLNVSLIESLDRQIALLTEAAARAQLLADSAATDREIVNALHAMTGERENGQYGNAVQSADDLLLQLARKELQQGKKLNYTAEIQTLTELRDALDAKLSESYTERYIEAGDRGGYFTRSYDGYESIYSYERVKDMSYDEFFSVFEQAPIETDRVIGKMIESYNWYLVAHVDISEADNFKNGRNYDIDFPDNDNPTMSMTLEKKVLRETDEANGEGGALLVFSCRNLPSDFAYTRQQNVTVSYGTVKGLQVSRSALHIIDGHPFVYTLYGAAVRMKAVDIIDRVGGYYYISPESESREIASGKHKGTYTGLRENDCVIVYGVDLSHGRIFK